MVELDAVWRCPRSVKINGKPQRVPFGVDLDPYLITFITKWVEHSGPQFAAKRVKSLKLWAIHILAGNREYSESWFARTHYKGYSIPKLMLFKYLIDKLHDLKVIQKVLIVLNSYKLVMQGEPSLTSIRKVEKSAPADPYISKLRLYVKLPHVPPDVLERTEAVDTRAKYADDFGGTYSGPFGWKDENFFLFREMNEDPYSLGKLVPIRDKGKWRNILVGHWAIQLQTKKLADWLRNWLWSQPEIASGDQNKMVDFCIQSLKKDKYMLSIDLSEATDRLSRDFQIKLLTSMGVPVKYFKFLELPFHYQGLDFGEENKIKKTYYSNGQPMGLFLSFPMFELAHYVVLKYACATSNSAFCICGDDVVVACDDKDRMVIFNRYKNLIERFGGVINSSKTIMSSKLCEGVGAIFLKGIPKEIRIPSGKVSTLEAFTPVTWLYQKIVQQTPVGRALMGAWLSTSLFKEYTYQQRMSMNEFMVSNDFSDWSLEALQSLDRIDHMPQTYSRFDEDLYDFWRNTPGNQKDPSFHWMSLRAYQDALVSNKIVSLYKKDIPCRPTKTSRR